MAPIRNILVADKNPHVSRLICRELEGAGFTANSVGTCREVRLRAGGERWADLLVIDPDLPDCQPGELLDEIAAARPEMTIIIHAFAEPPSGAGTRRVIEKAGNSIPRLVQLIGSLVPGHNDKAPA